VLSDSNQHKQLGYEKHNASLDNKKTQRQQKHTEPRGVCAGEQDAAVVNWGLVKTMGFNTTNLDGQTLDGNERGLKIKIN